MADRENFVPAKTLRSQSPLLVGDVLRAGDVILSRYPTEESQLLADATGGPFSHASLWIATGCLIEADGYGVGETFLHADAMSRKSGIVSVYRLPRPVVDVEVRRLDDLSKVSEEALEEALQQMRLLHLYRDYSEVKRLFPLVNWSPTTSDQLTRMFTKWEAAADKDAIPGAFCSELVALYFNALGLQPFNPARNPDSVSPNDFIKVGSLLRRIDDAVLRCDDIENDDYATAPNQHLAVLPARHKWLKSQIGIKRSTHALRNSIHAINTSSSRVQDFSHDLDTRRLLDIEGDVRELEKFRSTNGDSGYNGNVERYQVEVFRCRELLLEIGRHRSQLPEMDDASGASIRLKIAQEQCNLADGLAALSYRTIRLRFLLLSRHHRAKQGSNPISSDHRRVVINAVCKLKRDFLAQLQLNLRVREVIDLATTIAERNSFA